MDKDYELLDSVFPIRVNKVCKNFCKDYDQLLKPFGLSKLHAFYLMILFENNDQGYKLNDFNNILGCDKANTSRAIATLIEKRFIYKCKCTEKNFVVKLTQEGLELCKSFVTSVKDANYMLLNVLTNDEVSELYRLLNKVAKGDNNDTN